MNRIGTDHFSLCRERVIWIAMASAMLYPLRFSPWVWVVVAAVYLQLCASLLERIATKRYADATGASPKFRDLEVQQISLNAVRGMTLVTYIDGVQRLYRTTDPDLQTHWFKTRPEKDHA